MALHLLGNCYTTVLHLQTYLIIYRKESRYHLSMFSGLRGVNCGPYHVELQPQISQDQIFPAEIHLNINLSIDEKQSQTSHSYSSLQQSK